MKLIKIYGPVPDIPRLTKQNTGKGNFIKIINENCKRNHLQIITKLSTQKYLIISLLVVIAVWAIPYVISQDVATISSDFTYIPLTILLVITACFQMYQRSRDRENIFAWSLFFIFAITYTIAQHIWALNDLIIDQKPFPSLADVAFIIGTIILILFFMTYIKSKKQHVSKKMYVTSITASAFIISSSTFVFTSSNPELTLDQILLLAYPVLDSIALVPALIGMMLYFKTKLDTGSFLICCSMLPLTTGDILFQITTINGTSYSGSISDLFFYIQITLLIFGAYIISNKRIKLNPTGDQN